GNQGTAGDSAALSRRLMSNGMKYRRDLENGSHEREHLGAVYSLPDRNVVADGGYLVHWSGFLPAVAGRAASAGRLPDNPSLGVLAGWQPRNDGRFGGTAAGAAARSNPRYFADDLDELARLDRGH